MHILACAFVASLAPSTAVAVAVPAASGAIRIAKINYDSPGSDSVRADCDRPVRRSGVQGTRTMTTFDPRAYWEDRLSRYGSEEAVGHAGLGAGLNAWMFRVRHVVFLREVGAAIASLPSLSVLDVGSGTGVYVDWWRQLGVASITGSDIAQVAVDRLRARYPGSSFVRFAIGEQVPAELRGRRFGAISAMDVLFHVLDDDAYRQAFATLFALLEPGGLLVFTENFLHDEELSARHQRSRTLEEIEHVVRDAGFAILRRRPLFYLMNAPLDTRSRFHRAWWRALAGVASRSGTVGGWLGALLYRPELALIARLREGPSTEIMLCRRLA
jgi:SAM-dependent methyltransferase